MYRLYINNIIHDMDIYALTSCYMVFPKSDTIVAAAKTSKLLKNIVFWGNNSLIM